MQTQKYFITDVAFNKVYFKSTAGVYKNLGSITGIYPAPINELSKPELSVKNLLLSNRLIRIIALLNVNGKKSNVKLLCDSKLFSNVSNGAIGKSILLPSGRTGLIVSVSQPRKVVSRG